jgi:hypothetical protein
MPYNTKEASQEEELGIAFNVPEQERENAPTQTGPQPGTPEFQDLTATQKADILLAQDKAKAEAAKASAAPPQASTTKTTPGVTVTTSGKVEAPRVIGPVDTGGKPIPPGLLAKVQDAQQKQEQFGVIGKKTETPDNSAIKNIIDYQVDTMKLTGKNLGIDTGPTMTPAERSKAADNYKETLKTVALSMVPVVGTKMYYDDAAKDGLTPGEWAFLALQGAADILTILPGAQIVAGSARMTKGLGAAARVKAIGAGIKTATIAEIAAPFETIAHPIETAKSIIRPVKTMVDPKAIPTGALEIRYSTVRAPLDLFDNADQAMKLRDAAVLSRMTGGAGEAVDAEKTLKVLGTAANSPGESIAFHTTPDVRPYMDGVVIKEGREGGLFLSPNMNTRFADASAFGDLPEGGIKGGLLIRDEEILKQTIPSGKTYAETVEMERKIKPTVQLPKPSQVLTTYSTTGEPLKILVIGKPYTPVEIAKLKFYGSTDAVKNMFRDPLQVTGQAKKVEALRELEIEGKALTKEITAAKKAGKATAQLEKRLVATERQYVRYAEAINKRTVPAARLYAVTGKTAFDQFRDIIGRAQSSRGGRPAAPGRDRVEIDIPNRAPTAEEIRRYTQTDARDGRAPRVETPAARAGRVADDARAARVPDDTRIPRTTDEPRTSRAPDDRRTVRIPDEPRPPRRPPTDRTPDRIPDRPPARRTPPDAPTRVPPGEPPRVPPRVPPPVPGGGPARALPRGVKVDKALKEPPTPAQLAGAVAWPQGFGWRVAYRNDGGRLVSRFYHGQDPPQGVKTVLQGKGEAARGIQQYKGGAPVEGTVNMGAVDITVKKPQIRPGARGAISFRATRITPKRPRIGR